MADYVLSPRAEQDLLNIALYGLEHFGAAQSERYRDKLKKRFQEIAENPQHFPAVDYIRQRYRRSVCGSHAIYFQLTDPANVNRLIDFEPIVRLVSAPYASCARGY
ncbi:MAG: type II toxin-antitoxin system RelE/ParE family toxin [Magnetospiraceae bacterium]